MASPIVSIIMSTYNGSKYISESISSALLQTFSDFEFIIINDASTDDVESIILDFQKKDSRIVYIKNIENLKLTKSLNLWIKQSRWKYIARIDDDDIRKTTKLEKQFNFMENHDEYWLCWSFCEIINETWDFIWNKLLPSEDKDIRNNILLNNNFIHSSVIIRKSCLGLVWIYDPEYNLVEDYELWLRIWLLSKFHNIEECLVKYRYFQGSISRKKHTLQRLMSIKAAFKYVRLYPNKRNFLFKLFKALVPKKFTELYLTLYR